MIQCSFDLFNSTGTAVEDPSVPITLLGANERQEAEPVPIKEVPTGSNSLAVLSGLGYTPSQIDRMSPRAIQHVVENGVKAVSVSVLKDGTVVSISGVKYGDTESGSAMPEEEVSRPVGEPEPPAPDKVTPPLPKVAGSRRKAAKRPGPVFGLIRIRVDGTAAIDPGKLDAKAAIETVAPIGQLRAPAVPLVLEFAEDDAGKAVLADYILIARPDLTQAVMAALPPHFSLAEEE